MKASDIKAALLLTIFFAGLLQPQTLRAAGDSVVVQEAHSFGALTVWLLDGANSSSHPYLTLEEALRTGRAVIHENNSQELWIENKSDTDLFIQSADLIKGGQQDRMVEHDMIVGAHDTSMSLNVYCIEHDRSFKRGAEPIETFSSSDWRNPMAHSRLVALHALTEKLLSPQLGGLTAPDTNELNLLNSLGEAPQQFQQYPDAAQESIWNDVRTVQSDLTQTLKDSVTKNGSPSSLELALENENVSDREHSTLKKLRNLIENDPNAVGFVYALNGSAVSADEYGSHSLFASLWPKLSRGIVTEAMIETGGNSPVPPSVDDVEQFISLKSTTKTTTDRVNDRTEIIARKLDRAYGFETYDSKFPSKALHTSWLIRESE